MSRFAPEHLTPAQIEEQSAVYGPFTQAVRELVDAAIRTELEGDDIRAAQAQVEAVTARLRERQLDGSFGVTFSEDGVGRPWGNAVIGLRNAVAPPLVVEKADDGSRVWSRFHLGAAYEGPPGCVHGGVASLVLDQMLGQAAGAGGRPGMTATLQVHYRQPTPLGPLRAEAWIERSEGHKTWARGELTGPDGLCVEAEGLFILPRWAREQADAAATETPGGDAAPRPGFFE